MPAGTRLFAAPYSPRERFGAQSETALRRSTGRCRWRRSFSPVAAIRDQRRRFTRREPVCHLFGDDKTWVPRSVCADGDHVDVGDSDLEVENWWLRKEGML